MSDTRKCPQCSKPLPARAPEGLCPSCLLAGASGTDAGGGAARPRFEPLPLDRITEMFPQLEVQRLLGAGGMGAVYLARQPALDRMVALKILPAEGNGGAAFRERFNREARALARLSHPNIVTVHEFGEVQGLNYFIMEYVDGANLRQLQEGGRLSAREALQVIPQICDALQYAHDAGVVHRDIKPENVLLDRRGRVKIADFGLAKIMEPGESDHRLTMEGQVMGTPHYMAPEQVEKPLTVDHRADIYALGVVFYEMLTGDLPIGKFAPPSRKVQVDVRLDEIVLRALENDPARRYQQASEVKQRVATVMEGPAVPAGAGANAAPATSPSTDPDAPKPGVRYLRWLGIPVVKEQGEERELNFHGVLGAIFVTMMVSFVGHMLVRWITGGEHAMSGALHLAGLFVAIWGVRRTMNQPWPEAPARTPDGTEIVTPKRGWPYKWDAAMLVGLLMVVIGLHYLSLHVLRPLVRGRNVRAQVQQKATVNATDGTRAATLPNGGVVRLLAVSYGPGAAPNQWWRPDGRLSTTAYELHNPVSAGPYDGASCRMIFEVENLPSGASGLYFEGEPGSGAGSGGAVFSGGKPLGRAQVAAFGWKEQLKRGTVRAGLAMDPWRTLATYIPAERRMVSGGPSQKGEPRWEVQVHDVVDTTEGAQVTAVLPAEDRAWRIELAAFDLTGAEVFARRASGSGTSGGRDSVWTYLFPGVSVREMKEFRIQVRPVHWIEFPDVELHPDGPLPEARWLRFAPVAKVTFDGLLDFDTLKAGDFPAAAPGEPPFAGIAEGILWAQKQGFDGHAGAEGLEILDATFAPVEDADWDRLDPQQVIDRMYRARFAPRVLKPTGTGGRGDTFAYQTREGGFGLIRLDSVGAGRITSEVSVKRIER